MIAAANIRVVSALLKLAADRLVGGRVSGNTYVDFFGQAVFGAVSRGLRFFS